MKIMVESTTKIVELVVEGNSVPARIWEGTTEGGISVHCYITRIAVHREADTAQFEEELLEQRAPCPEIEAIPLRLIL
jgi:hypothetical protein